MEDAAHCTLDGLIVGVDRFGVVCHERDGEAGDSQQGSIPLFRRTISAVIALRLQELCASDEWIPVHLWASGSSAAQNRNGAITWPTSARKLTTALLSFPPAFFGLTVLTAALVIAFLYQ
jgi:hypothetical protein